MSGIYRGVNGSAIANALNIDGNKGDLTISNSGLEWTVNPDVVVFSKIQNVSTDTVLGRSTAGTGDIEEITCTAAGRALLDDVNAAAQRTTLGLGNAATATIGTEVLAYDSNLQSFVNTFTLPTADALNGYILTTNGLGTLNLTAPGGVSDADYGDITVATGGTVWTIDNDAVTYAKIQNVSATDKLLGRSTAGAGDIEEIACTSAGRALLDDIDASAQRTTLGLGTIATQSSSNVTITGGSITGITDLAIADGGTGASTAVAAFTNLKQEATDTATGVVELLTNAEYVTGTDTTRALTASVARARNIVPGTSVAASGTSVDFTGIPSWVKRITIILSEVSTNGTADLLVQLGDSGGIENTGYISTYIVLSSGGSSTAGYIVRSGAAAVVATGTMTINLIDTLSWVSTHAIKVSTTNASIGAGSKTLSATLDRVRITTTNGTDTFDAGTINIFYE